ncbi:MAG: alcohol dehydrogenase catalytic domain-containing protein [Verrucomicrobiota bacterium]
MSSAVKIPAVFDIPKTMRAVVYRGVNDLRVETVPVPRISANELLVKVAVCGVCPTDIKKIQYGAIQPPRIFGHETAGTIVKLGARSKEQGFKLGDRVALHHHVPCRHCHFCRHSAFAQCATYKRTGITAGFEPAGGGFAEYVRVMNFVLPGVVKIPARNAFEEGAMLEPVNTVLKAVKRLSILRGDVVLVAGQGPIGLMFTRLLQLQGANVIATDLLEPRLRFAKKFGARWMVQVPSSKSKVPSPKSEIQNQISTVSAFCLPPSAFPIDAAVIAVPSDEVVQQALQLVRGGGQVLLFAHTKSAEAGKQKAEAGSPTSDLRPPTSDFRLPASGLCPLDLSSVCLDEKDLLGSYSSDFTLQREVARLVFSRQLDVRGLISHRFPLEQTAAAVALAAHPGPDSLKILVTQIG